MLGGRLALVIYPYLLKFFLLGKALNNIAQKHYGAFGAALMPEVYYTLLTSNCYTLGYTNHYATIRNIIKISN